MRLKTAVALALLIGDGLEVTDQAWVLAGLVMAGPTPPWPHCTDSGLTVTTARTRPGPLGQLGLKWSTGWLSAPIGSGRLKPGW